MFVRSLSILLILTITACPMTCRLGVCACADARQATCDMTQSCCSVNPANNDATPANDPSDNQSPCKSTCICGGAVLGDGVDLDLVCQGVFDVALPFDTALADSTATKHNDLNPGDRPVRSGRMIRYQLMSLLC